MEASTCPMTCWPSSIGWSPPSTTRRTVRDSSIVACGGQAPEQVFRHHDVIQVAQAVLQLSERAKIGLLALPLIKGAKELRGVPKLLERDPQLVALLG